MQKKKDQGTSARGADIRPERGEVWWIAYDSQLAGEADRPRPAVIVSNDAANRGLARVQVVPLTTNIGALYPSEAEVTVAGTKYKAMADKLSAVSKARLTGKIGRIEITDMAAIERAIRVQFGL